MTGAKISLAIDDAEVLEAIAALQAAAGNLGGVYRNIGEELLQSTQDRFKAGKGPDGKAWTPLSPRTVRAKRAAGHSPAILVMRGYLAGTIRYQATDDGVEVGTDRPYGAIHQFGGEISRAARTQTVRFRIDQWTGKSGRTQTDFRPGFAKAKAANYERTVAVGEHTIKIPARPYLGLSEADKAAVLAIIADHLTMAVPQMEGGDAV